MLTDLGETNTGDPQVLEEFLAFGVSTYPSERHALVIWNHGSGVYVPEEKPALSMSRSCGPTASDTIPPQPNGPLPAISEPGPRPNPLGFGLAHDDQSGDCLDTTELERVLATGHRLLGRKIDLVGMDACLMAMLEIAWQLRDHARVLRSGITAGLGAHGVWPASWRRWGSWSGMRARATGGGDSTSSRRQFSLTLLPVTTRQPAKTRGRRHPGNPTKR